jgi:con80 domain of Katanin
MYLHGCSALTCDAAPALQKLTIPPKPGMSNACTEVGDSLARGALTAALPTSQPARRASRDVPVEIYAAPAPSATGAATPTSQRGSGGGAAGTPPLRRASQAGDGATPAARTPLQPDDTPVSATPDAGALIKELTQLVEKKHARFMDAMDERASKLALVQTFWARGHLVGCLQAMRRAQDICLATDMFRMLSEGSRPTHFKVDMCEPAAPSIYACLTCPIEPVVATALKFLLLLLESFGPKIRELSRVRADDCDIGGVERRQRLAEAREALCSIDDGDARKGREGALACVLKRNFSGLVHARAQRARDMIAALKSG